MRVRSPRPPIPAQAVQLGWTLIFLVFILLVLNAAGWFYYRSFRANWEAELDRSLTAVASTAASRVTAVELRDLLDNGRFGFAYSTLRRQWLRTRSSTSWIRNIFLFDREGQTLVDLEADPPLRQKNPALVLDPRDPELAFLGRPTASGLYQIRNVYYKTAFAPVAMDSSAAEALLAIEADASFFTGLDRMRGSLLLVAAVSTFAVLLLGLVFVRATRGLMLAEERARRNETLASMGQLTATMAHEIRNPLAVIRATAERLKNAPPEDEIWQYIPEEVERLNGILSTYLDFARSDPELSAELDLRESLDRVRLLCEPNLAKTGVRVVTDFPAHAGEALIQGSPAAIRQVFLNLILNAQEAMPKGGDLGLSIRREGRDWVCEVSDTGQGIAREALRKIFDPFYSSKERGTGLGLAVVDRIVREHRGRVEVRSRPGHGSVFQIRFPARTS